ncbi:MAG: iduronate-2-sulfatase, partial [Armatimonadota bacterium]
GTTRPGSRCARPVDLMTLFPTLCDLCRLPTPAWIDDPSIRGLLARPNSPWHRPARTTFNRGNHAVRSERWRYIRYADGGEELYDHGRDPYEWTNRASDPRLRATKDALSTWLPRREAPQPDKDLDH